MEFRKRVGKAVQHFWETRAQQSGRQGAATGSKDAGYRAEATGGKQLDGFADLLTELLVELGLPGSAIHRRQTTLPGYFRPTKNWDVVVIVDGILLASIELKAHVGPSFGNNFNNRVEEALGSSIDVLAAYREGMFKPSQKPWLGWLMLLEDAPKSTSPVSVDEPHYRVLTEFRGASYARRYELFCERLVRERMYDGACLILTNRVSGLRGAYTEPNVEFGFAAFATSLTARVLAHTKSWGQ